MIPKNMRGLSPREFSEVYKYGRYKKQGCLLVKWRKRDSSGGNTKIAVVVASRYFRKNVLKNRFRRKLQAIVVPLVKEINGIFDIIFIWQCGAEKFDAVGVSGNLKSFLNKIS